MSYYCRIDFTDKESKLLLNNFIPEKVERIRIFKTLEINCTIMRIKSNSFRGMLENINFSPITTFSFVIDSICHIGYLSICTQDLCMLIEIDDDGLESENFRNLLEKMKDTLLISSLKQQNLFLFFANSDEYFFLNNSTVTFLKDCVSKLKSYFIKEYDLLECNHTMTYKNFLIKSLKSILYYFLYRQSMPSELFVDKAFFESPLSLIFKKNENTDFLLLEIIHYDPSYFIQYAFHKETHSLVIAYVFRVEPSINFWERSFTYKFILKMCGNVEPKEIEFNIHSDENENENNLEEEEEDDDDDDEFYYGGQICPFINMVNVSQLNKLLLLNETLKTKIIYTIFYTLEYIYYFSNKKIESPDIFLTKMFIDSDSNVIISNTIDFFDTFQTGHVESPVYLPTEFIECVDKKNEKTDIYSAGVCIYLLLSGDDSLEKMNFFQLNDLLHKEGFPVLSEKFKHLAFIQKICVSDFSKNKRKTSFLLILLLKLFHCRVEGTDENEISEYIECLEKQRNFERNESYIQKICEIEEKSSDKSNFEYLLQMGLLLLFGEGVDKNVSKGLKFIKISAEGGYEDAIYILEYIQSNSLFEI